MSREREVQKIEERLRYLLENSTVLYENDLIILNRLFLKTKNAVNARLEPNEALKNNLFAYNDVFKRRIELEFLLSSLYPFIEKKGLSQSMLKVNEIISLIHSDIRLLNDNLDNLQEAKDDIKRLLKQQKS